MLSKFILTASSLLGWGQHWLSSTQRGEVVPLERLTQAHFSNLVGSENEHFSKSWQKSFPQKSTQKNQQTKTMKIKQHGVFSEVIRAFRQSIQCMEYVGVFFFASVEAHSVVVVVLLRALQFCCEIMSFAALEALEAWTFEYSRYRN